MDITEAAYAAVGGIGAAAGGKWLPASGKLSPDLRRLVGLAASGLDATGFRAGEAPTTINTAAKAPSWSLGLAGSIRVRPSADATFAAADGAAGLGGDTWIAGVAFIAVEKLQTPCHDLDVETATQRCEARP